MIRIEVPFDVKNVAEVVVCDILADVDIRIMPKQPIREVEGKIAIEAVQNNLRMLAGEMNQLIKDRIREAITSNDTKH